MRLLNTTSLKLVEFSEREIPLYAILSHRWGPCEVSLQDLERDKTAGPKEDGFRKIKATCELAVSHGLEYVWIDTCCIDKTSSAELSEAINSMYRWYQDATVCYAHLADVTLSPSGDHRQPGQNPPEGFTKSIWFTRGWTLQELIAPSTLLFVDSSWTEIGFKVDAALCAAISSHTGIPQAILKGTDSPDSASVAERMFWASARETTRSEDMAYCLMGLFGVHMPMLYGEGGKKAFSRLQEEIIKTSDDYTIFAWYSSASVPPIPTPAPTGRSRGIGRDMTGMGPLASSPRDFKSRRRTRQKPYPGDASHGRGRIISADNNGIHLQLRVFRKPNASGEHVAVLPCSGTVADSYLVISLRPSRAVPGAFYRVWTQELDRTISRAELVVLCGKTEMACPETKICILHVRAAKRGAAQAIFRVLNQNENQNQNKKQHGEGEGIKAATTPGQGSTTSSEKIISLLLRGGGAHIETRNEETRATPLIWAASLGREGMVSMLLERGANIEAVDDLGMTALLEAAANGHISVVRLLAEKGGKAALEVRNSTGSSALVCAAEKGHAEVVKALVEAGADIDALCDGRAETSPLGAAIVWNRQEIVELLVEKGANLDGEGSTPLLFLAMEHGRYEAAKLLIEKGANVEITHRNGLTPLRWVSSFMPAYGNPGPQWKLIAKLLSDKGASL